MAWKIAVLFFSVMSVCAFFNYGLDKHKAKHHRWRTPEKLLLGLGFFGGSVGALAGMQLFRHKTKHWYFWAVNIAGLLWQALVLLWLLKGVFL